MIRFFGCMFMGLIVYAGVILVALLWDWSKFKDIHPREDLRELWNISVGAE